MLRMGICDDEPNILNYLSALCTKILPEVVIAE